MREEEDRRGGESIKMIDLQGQRHRKVPLDSDRSGSLQSSVYNRLTENEVAASHAVSRAGWSEKDHRRGFQTYTNDRDFTQSK